jgi:hypothetical protein
MLGILISTPPLRRIGGVTKYRLGHLPYPWYPYRGHQALD